MGNPASSDGPTPLSPARLHFNPFTIASALDFTQQQSARFASSQPPSLSTLQHFSDLRTTNQRAFAAMQTDNFRPKVAGDCPCMKTGGTPPLACEQCVHECDSTPCTVALSAECTDQCVVVACSQDHHGVGPCDSAHPDQPCEPCDVGCPVGTDCIGLEEFFQCCTDYHDYLSGSRAFPHSVNSGLTWDPSVAAAFLCGCPEGSVQVGNAYPSNNNFSSVGAAVQNPQFMSSSVFQSGSAPSNVQPSPSPSHSVPSPQSQQLSPFLPNAEASQHQEPQSPMHKCQWGGCFATFSSLAELVGHVNLQHLRIPSPVSSTSSSSGLSPGPKVPHTPQIQQQINNASMDTNALSCLWADCQLYPTPQSIPGPSTGNAVNSALGLLASHLLEDHLGLPARTPKQEQAANKMQGLLANPAAPIVQPQPQPHAFPSPASVASSGNDAANSHTSTPAPSSHTGTPAPSGPPAHGPPTPVPEHDCSAPSAHVCRWAGCTETFGACDALTAHITAAHVGGGRAHYDCFWGGCTRNGEQGFASKQKILRHLQSHTGHRPFQCKICSQNFSEAATLAQHMRRHTQEST
ncbi:hypothetical protein AcW1_006688 [Taiwanofungus camphoratus]|nr:hypothetical protein AcV5_009275 [Antrodia cinnamomea]KAI0924614.1 hypothetical protein AcW2_005451 [Antrodia cinnamomea]KAI0954027.1 hypothetical protein AcV7_007382 [Antrodia cinnamomea]KAI0954955.1 hypothetical protein AcW1_006688 [Antrodia cinnamomea]